MSPSSRNSTKSGASSKKSTPSSSDNTKSLDGLANLTLGPHEGRNNFTGTSTTNRAQQARGIYTPPFIRNGASPNSNPFSSPAIGSNPGPSTPGSRFQAMNRQSWRSSSASSDSSTGAASTPSARRKLFTTVRQPASSPTPIVASQGTPRPVDTSRRLDPQALFPVTAAVFVANLRQGETDSALEVAITRTFRQFGHVWVKVKRDRKDMPMAFLQYRLDDHAQLAIDEGYGMLICNRPCRVEPGRANREYYIERRGLRAITNSEARLVLRRYGNILESHVASISERSLLDVGEGVIVKFEFYDNGVAALNDLRNSEEYRVQAINTLTRNSYSSHRGNVSAEDRAFLEAHELDGRSIHVGNLHVEVTDADIRGLFSRFGNILNVEIRHFPSKFEPYNTQVFAFVEFEDVRSPWPAIQAMRGYVYENRALRVSQKKTEPRVPSVSPVNTSAPRTSSSGSSSRVQSGTSAFQTPPTAASASTMMQTPPASAPGFSGSSMMQTPASNGIAYVVPASMMQAPPAYGASAFAAPGFVTSPYTPGLANPYTPGFANPFTPGYDQSTGFYSPTYNVNPYQFPPWYGSQTYNYGYPGFASYPSYTGQQVYPSQFPTPPMYSTPAAAQVASDAHAHPQTETMTPQDGSDVTQDPVDHSNAYSEVDESG